MSLTYIREYAEDGGIFSEVGAQPGSPLTDLLDKERPSVKVALELGAALGDILAIAEEDGKAHGDPKIGMVRLDSHGNTALEEFRDGRRTTRAPEPKPVGPPSDIYGLGVILHSLLSTDPLGRIPKTQEAHDEAIVKKVLAYDLGPAEGQAWTMELKEFFCSMMAYSPSERPGADEVADVLGNAADSLDGENLGAWAAQAAAAGATTARAKAKAAPPEELAGVRTVHVSGTAGPADAPPEEHQSTAAFARAAHGSFLDEEPETELAATTIKSLIEGDALGDEVPIVLDASLDETLLDRPESADEIVGFAHNETRIDELPVEAMSEDSLSIHEQETLIGENVLRAAAIAEAKERKAQGASTITPLDETRAADPKPQGIIKGPALPPPPPGAKADAGGSKKGLLLPVLLLAGVAVAYVATQGDETEGSPDVEMPGPILQEGEVEIEIPAAIEEGPAEEAMEAQEAMEDPPEPIQAAPEKAEELPPPTPPAPSPAPAQAAPPPRKPAPPPPRKPAPPPVAAPAPAPVAAPAPTPVAAPPTPEPAPAPAAQAPPYRIRVDIKGSTRSLTCGDGQSPEVLGPLSLTFQSEQYCRVEIDGVRGVLHVASSGSYTCTKTGQVICSKVR
jgi:hypothetical protein